jgi:hypothetical protein
MFSIVGVAASAMAVATLVFVLLAEWRHDESGNVVILAAVTICWLTLAGFLFMAGIIAECFLDAEEGNKPFESMLLRPMPSRRRSR